MRKANREGSFNSLVWPALFPILKISAGSLLSRFPDEKRPLVSIDISILTIAYCSSSTSDMTIQQGGWMLVEDPVATAGMTVTSYPRRMARLSSETLQSIQRRVSAT